MAGRNVACKFGRGVWSVSQDKADTILRLSSFSPLLCSLAGSAQLKGKKSYYRRKRTVLYPSFHFGNGLPRGENEEDKVANFRRFQRSGDFIGNAFCGLRNKLLYKSSKPL